jgi:hypothetical protein
LTECFIEKNGKRIVLVEKKQSIMNYLSLLGFVSVAFILGGIFYSVVRLLIGFINDFIYGNRRNNVHLKEQ